jgi:hypothetical protein
MALITSMEYEVIKTNIMANAASGFLTMVVGYSAYLFNLPRRVILQDSSCGRPS